MISEGKTSKFVARPVVLAAPPFKVELNDSVPLVKVRAFTVPRTKSGPNPRIETKSPSPRSLLIATPGTRCSASAMLRSGSLPTSSALIASTILAFARLASIELRTAARIPVTTISSITASWACEESAGSPANTNALPIMGSKRPQLIFIFMFWPCFDVFDSGASCLTSA